MGSFREAATDIKQGAAKNFCQSSGHPSEGTRYIDFAARIELLTQAIVIHVSLQRLKSSCTLLPTPVTKSCSMRIMSN